MIQNRESNLLFAWWIALALLASPPLHADDRPNALQKATTFAQNRVVKVYGAKVGRTPGYATGLIIGAKGQILTANGSHLNGDRIRVVLPDGTSHVATAERRSRADQLAVLRVPADTKNYFDLSKASTTYKGQWIVAISNLFKIADGAEPESAMLGVVALETKLEAKRGNQAFPYEGEVLLLDSITSNPGAPGGAVVDAQTGRLVGMIGPVLESRSSGTKLNYAIPTKVLNDFVNNKKPAAVVSAGSKPRQVFLGIRLFRLDGKRAPAYVDRVAGDSPAAKAGLRPDDAILGIADERIKTIRQYDEILKRMVPGETVDLAIKRGDKLMQVKITPTAVTEQP